MKHLITTIVISSLACWIQSSSFTYLTHNRSWSRYVKKAASVVNEASQYSLSRHSLELFMHSNQDDGVMDRRAVHGAISATLGVVTASMIAPSLESRAAVGSLPEFANTNAVIQGITVNVADRRQFLDMIEFLREGMNFKVLRQAAKGSVSSVVSEFDNKK